MPSPRTKLTPVKASSGDGFVFEEKVGAYFAAHLLSGVPFPDERWGKLTRLDFQMRVDEWQFDDMVSTHQLDGRTCRCGFNIKSNRQIKREGAAKGLVRSAWEHFANPSPTGFDRTCDWLGYIGTRHTPEVWEAMQVLAKQAREQQPDDLHRRIGKSRYVSPLARKLYRSFQGPRGMGNSAMASRLLARFCYLEFDFDAAAGSSRLTEARMLCRALIEPGEAAKVEDLWMRLQSIVRECRTAGGYLDAPKLVALLRPHHAVRGHPDLSADTAAIAEFTRASLARLPDSFGGRISLLRTEARRGLAKTVAAGKIVAVVGDSGDGKTTLVRHWLLSRDDGVRGSIWIPVKDLERRRDEGARRILGLRREPAAVFAQMPGQYPVLVLDGLEHAYSESTYEIIRELIEACGWDEAATSYSVVCTCQAAEWDRVRSRLAHARISRVEVHQLRMLEAQDTAAVLRCFPMLFSLVLKPHLTLLLRRPKFLDLVVQQCQTHELPRLNSWVGESDFIGWWWEQVVAGGRPGSPRASVARALGRSTADRLVAAVPTDDLTLGLGEAVADLVAVQVCEEAEGRLSFAHDLYADWARQRQLLAHRTDLAAFILPRIELPTWRKAVRLLGLHYLERDSGNSAWHELMKEFAGEEARHVLVRDLLLESVIFVADPDVLERLWPALHADQGALLNRLLRSFLHVATYPHPKLAEILGPMDARVELEAAALHRLPYWQYWTPMIEFLWKHALDVVELAPVLVAEITARWLQSTAPDWPERMLAAQLAVLNARRALRLENAEHYGSRWSAPEVVYRALLLATPECPDAVQGLALKLSGRRPLETGDIERMTAAQVAAEAKRAAAMKADAANFPVPLMLGSLTNEPEEPWPAGPVRPSCDEFQTVFMEEAAVAPFLRCCPEAAAEVTLALLIEPPCSRRYGRGGFDRHGLQHIRNDFPPFCTKGPFLLFLRLHPKQAIRMIGKLVTFATDRVAELDGDLSDDWATVTVPDGEAVKTWRGNRQVYFWYRTPLMTEDTISSALMALEKFLYERQETGDAMEEWLAEILASSDSVAMPGVLLGFAKRHQEHLLGRLWPYFTTHDFQIWEAQHIPLNEPLGVDGGFLVGAAERELRREWHAMPHRRLILGQIAWSMFLNEPAKRRRFAEVKKRWLAEASALPEEERRGLVRSAGALTFSRWGKNAEGTWVYHEPKRPEDEEKKRPYEERLAFGSLVYRVRERISQGLPLSDEEVAKGWELLEQIRGQEAKAPEDELQSGKTDALAAVIAYFTLLAPEWLARSPERFVRCRSELTKIILTIRGRGARTYHDSGDTNAEAFSAEALPAYWAERPEDGELRECVCKIALAGSGASLRLMMLTAARHREKLGAAFIELQQLNLRWAVILRRLNEQQFRRQEQEDFDVEAWTREWASKFVERRMPPPPGSWVELAASTDFPPDKEARWTAPHSFRRAFDIHAERMLAASAWASHFSADDTPALRAERIATHAELLALFLRSFPVAPRFEVEGSLFRFDQQVLEATAELILQLRDDEDTGCFWRPILALGAPCHHWVETFLTHFFLTGLREPARHPAFERLWRQMLDYAFTAWGLHEERCGYRLEGLWEHLLGMDSVVAGVWGDENEALLGRMSSYYERWAKAWLGSRCGGTGLVNLLKRPPARLLLLSGLEWLLPVWEKADFARYGRGHEERAYADFLAFLWNERWSDIKTRPAALHSFREIANKLAAAQNTLALEITARIAAGSAGER